MKKYYELLKTFIKRNPFLKKILVPIYRFVINTINIKRYMTIYSLNRTRIENQTSKEKIWYFCVPVHANLGDQAQACCIRKWLSENYSEREVVEIYHNGSNFCINLYCDFLDKLLLRKIKDHMKENDLIFIQSGYTMMDTHPYQKVYLRVVELFPNNRIIFLPQTINYNTNIAKKHIKETLDTSRNVFLLCRDTVSLKTAEELLPNCRKALFPDIVTTLIGKFNFCFQRSGILLCTRKDDEKYYSEKDIRKLKKSLELIEPVETTDTTFDFDPLCGNNEIWELVMQTIKEYSQKKIVITDRYHGTIFSMVANTPVVVIKTLDHKVVTGLEWFKGIYDNAIFYADSIDDAIKICTSILENKLEISNKPYFYEQYYKKLRKLIESSLQ